MRRFALDFAPEILNRIVVRRVRWHLRHGQVRRLGRQEGSCRFAGVVLGAVLRASEKQRPPGLAQDRPQECLVSLTGELAGAGLIEKPPEKYSIKPKTL